jgi:uncharacterized membrane protein YdjX (TVP38/TMEM64 family)
MPLNQIDLKARAHARVTHKRTSKLPLIISLGLLITLIASYFIFPGYRAGIDEAVEVLTSEDEARVAEWVSQFGIWGPLMIIVGMVLQMFFFIIPNILLIFISVVSYGPVWGSLLAWFGMLLASTTGYFIGNKLSHVIVDRLVSPKTQEKLREFIRMYGMKAIIALRVSSLSNDGLSLVAGLLKMQYRRFITATLIGVTPLIAVIAIFGHSGRIERALVGTGLFLIAGLIVYIIVDRRRNRGKH